MKTFREMLLDKFKPYFVPTKEELDDYINISRAKNISAKTIIKTQDQDFNELWFVSKGMVRTYIIDNNKDYTVGFYTPGFFLMDPLSFGTKSNSQFCCETMFDTTLHCWNFNDLIQYWSKYPNHKNGRRLLIESRYLQLVDRLVDFQTNNLKDRYLKMIELHGDIINVVPQYHLASYLGVKPQSLSRIKKEILQKNKAKSIA